MTDKAEVIADIKRLQIGLEKLLTVINCMSEEQVKQSYMANLHQFVDIKMLGLTLENTFETRNP